MGEENLPIFYLPNMNLFTIIDMRMDRGGPPPDPKIATREIHTQ